MIDFNNHKDIISAIKTVQEAEEDIRQQARDCQLFVYKKDGQWDPYAVQKMQGRFRGTFDMCMPVVDQVSGEIDEADFTLRIRPASGDASKEVAKVMSGLVRNIRNISNFDDGIIPRIGRSILVGGFSAVEVVPDYIDADTFDQDLFIRFIPNAVDTVFFDPNSTRQDGSDAQWVIKLTQYTKDEFERQFGDDERYEGVDSGAGATAFYNKADTILVGQIYYKKPVEIEIAQMSNGAVYRVDEDYELVRDELELAGITEKKRRKRKSYEVKSRLFSGNRWLGDEEDTVFNMLPIIPFYGNFEIIENKSVWFGKILKLMDHQRVLNYAVSRDIEDGALSPSPTVWMTKAMGAGNDYSKMNIDRKPVRFFNPEPTAPGMTPQQTGGPVASQGLQTTIQNMQSMFNISSNTFNAQTGNAAPTQSGIAGLQQIEAGNTGSLKWFKSIQVGIAQLGRVIVNAIPLVYDATRQARIVDEDGTTKITPINQGIIDDSGEIIYLNDLTVGEYDVLCDFGPAFKTQQEKTAQAFIELASLDPSIIMQGKDILIKNLATVGMDQLSERVREDMVNNGLIPDSQLSEEEAQRVMAARQAAANQPPQPSPEELLAQAEIIKGQAEQAKAEVQAQELQAKFQLEQTKLQIEAQKVQLDAAKFERDNSDKYNKDLISANQNQQKIDLQAQAQQFDQMMKAMQAQQQQFSQAVNDLKVLREAMGVDAIISGETMEAYNNQAEKVDDLSEKPIE